MKRQLNRFVRQNGLVNTLTETTYHLNGAELTLKIPLQNPDCEEKLAVNINSELGWKLHN